jgi:RNA recognition motif-containing protein
MHLSKGGYVNIYIGNLASGVTESDLQKAFETFGNVVSATIIKDRYSGQSRGFGFIDMPSKEEAEAAIAGMNGKEFMGRVVKVNEARPRSDRRGSKKRGGGKRRSW